MNNGWEYNSNGKQFEGVDRFLGKAAVQTAWGTTFPAGTGFLMGQASKQSLGLFASVGYSEGVKNIGTAVRYGLGGGMDTYTFKDGSKAHQFSDGDEILTDKNGKYIGSFYSN